MKWKMCDDGKDLCVFPGAVRGTTDGDNIYKIRTAVERSISHFKDSFSIADRKTQNPNNLLAGIALLFSVILADKLHQRLLFRSVKYLIA